MFETRVSKRDNDRPYTILFGVIVSRQKREEFAIEKKGYLLQVLLVRVPDCNTTLSTSWPRIPTTPLEEE